MDYLLAVIITIFLLAPFVIMSDTIFKLLQIPFALIHRYAACAVVVLQIYMLCQYFNILIMSFTHEMPFLNTYMKVELQNPAILIVIFTAILILILLSMIYSAPEKDRKFLFILSLISVPSFWIIYFCKITFLYQPIKWYFYLIEWILDIPILGNLLGFALVGLGLYFIFKLIVFYPIMIVRLFANTKNR